MWAWRRWELSEIDWMMSFSEDALDVNTLALQFPVFPFSSPSAWTAPLPSSATPAASLLVSHTCSQSPCPSHLQPVSSSVTIFKPQVQSCSSRWFYVNLYARLTVGSCQTTWSGACLPVSNWNSLPQLQALSEGSLFRTQGPGQKMMYMRWSHLVFSGQAPGSQASWRPCSLAQESHLGWTFSETLITAIAALTTAI